MMSPGLRQSKITVRTYLRTDYKDEHLAVALDRAREGALLHNCNRCFAALPKDRCYEGAMDRIASLAYCELGVFGSSPAEYPYEAIRQRRLTAIMKAEIRRRMRLEVEPILESETINETIEA